MQQFRKHLSNTASLVDVQLGVASMEKSITSYCIHFLYTEKMVQVWTSRPRMAYAMTTLQAFFCRQLGKKSSNVSSQQICLPWNQHKKVLRCASQFVNFDEYQNIKTTIDDPPFSSFQIRIFQQLGAIKLICPVDISNKNVLISIIFSYLFWRFHCISPCGGFLKYGYLGSP